MAERPKLPIAHGTWRRSDDTDGGCPARGVMIGLAISAMIWAVIALLVFGL